MQEDQAETITLLPEGMLPGGNPTLSTIQKKEGIFTLLFPFQFSHRSIYSDKCAAYKQPTRKSVLLPTKQQQPLLVSLSLRISSQALTPCLLKSSTENS